MPRARVQDRQAGYGGGLNLSADPSQVQPSQARQLENARLTQFGAVSKRLGTRQLMETALGGAVQNGHTWFRLTSTDILAVANGTLYVASLVPFTAPEFLLTEALDTLVTESADMLVTEASFTTFTAKSGTLSTSQAPEFATFRSGSGEVVYIADGGRLNRWDGTTLTTDIADTPEVVSICVYNQRLIGVTGQNQSVFYSTLNNGDTLGIAASGGGEAIIRTFSNQRTTAVATNGSTLFIFHEDGISRFVGYTQDDIAISAAAASVTGQTGTQSPLSLVSTARGIFFLGNDGFFVLGDGVPERISQPVDALVRSWTGNTIRSVRGVHAASYGEVRWFVPDYGVLTYNYVLGAWCGPDTGGYLSPTTTCLFESQNDAGRTTVLRGDSTGFVSLCDVEGTYLDNVALDGAGGDAFTLRVQNKRFFAGDYAGEKSLRDGYLIADTKGSASVVVKWDTGRGERSKTLSAADSGSRMQTVPMHDRGSYVDVTLEDSGAVESVYTTFEIEAFAMGRRGP